MNTPLRTLRSLAPNKWAVIIDTHAAPEPREADEYDPYEGIEVKGQRPLGEPVAVIRQTDAFTCEIWVDRGELKLLATVQDADVVNVAHRIAEGEFDDDFRFEYCVNPEPSFPGDLYYITQYATPSQQRIDSFTTHDPGDVIASAREAQAYTLEERLDRYAEMGL